MWKIAQQLQSEYVAFHSTLNFIIKTLCTERIEIFGSQICQRLQYLFSIDCLWPILGR